MNLTPFFVYALPVFTALAVAALGSTRRLGFWPTLVATLLLTPVGGYIAAMLSGPRRPRAISQKSWL